MEKYAESEEKANLPAKDVWQVIQRIAIFDVDWKTSYYLFD